MTSAAAAINVTFDGTDCTDFEGIFLYRIDRGAPGTLPEVAGADDPLPGADGMFLRNRRKRRRVIELMGFIRGVSSDEAADRDDYWVNRSAVETLFDPTQVGVLTVDTGGVTYSIDARPLPSLDFVERTPSFAEVSILLEAVTPDWESEVDGS